MNSSSATKWQSELHLPVRQRILNTLAALMRQRRCLSLAKARAIEHLPDIARKVEFFLYTRASSFEEYKNPLTLKRRLRFLICSMFREAEPESKKRTRPSSNYERVSRRRIMPDLLLNNQPELLAHIFSYLPGTETIACRQLNSSADMLLRDCVKSLVLTTNQLECGLAQEIQKKYERVEELTISRKSLATSEDALLAINCSPLDMADENCGEMVMKTLAQLLEQGSFSHLKKLVLCSIFSSTIKTNAIESLSQALPAVKHLETLSLAGNSIGDIGAVALSKCLAQCDRLRNLDLRSNFIAEKGIQALMDAFQHQTRGSTLHDLCLGGNILTDACAIRISDTLASGQLSHLRFLGLEHNFIEKNGFRTLLSHSCPELKHISCEGNTLDELNVK